VEWALSVIFDGTTRKACVPKRNHVGGVCGGRIWVLTPRLWHRRHQMMTQKKTPWIAVTTAMTTAAMAATAMAMVMVMVAVEPEQLVQFVQHMQDAQVPLKRIPRRPRPPRARRTAKHGRCLDR